MIGEQGKIKGLYNLIYEEQHIIKELLSNYFHLDENKISIKLRSADLSIIVYADIISFKRDKISILIVNRLDEYIYNFDDITLLNKFIRIINNRKRLKVIKRLMKKSGQL